MFDSFMTGGPGGFGGPDGVGGMDDFLDPYGEGLEPELDEHEEKFLRVANCLGLYVCGDFEVTLQNACYMCDVDPDEFDEYDLAELRAMVE